MTTMTTTPPRKGRQLSKKQDDPQTIIPSHFCQLHDRIEQNTIEVQYLDKFDHVTTLNDSSLL